MWGVPPNPNTIWVPSNYVSGTPLSGTATYAGTDIATMGMTHVPNGATAATWGTGASADSFIIVTVLAPYNCSAGLTTVPEYCADDSDVGWGTPTCDPLVIQWADAAGPTPGDTVTITVRVQNSSSYNNVSAPPDPPAAYLAAGETFTVGYSCPTGACASVNTGWLTGCTASNTHADISFADNGDGTGTVTIDNDIPLPAGIQPS